MRGNGSSALAYWLGAAALLLAVVASALLAIDHFDLSRLPGCGPQSGCEQATRGPWGRLPLVHWPLSLVGVAWFTALLVAWLSPPRGVSASLRWLARIGGAGSLFLIGVMIFGGYLCKYCLVAHIGNLLFIAAMELAATGAARGAFPRAIPRHQPVTISGVFIVVTAGLAVAHTFTHKTRLARAETLREESAREMTEGRADASASVYGTANPFTGRWRLGPEDAPIRVVMFDDYQCTDCKAIEMQVRRLIARRDDISISVKHFPMNSLCNEQMKGANPHPNACWAARAAEAAGILRGNDGFWAMHHWLFEQGGSFTDASLPGDLARMGYDPQEFIAVMSSAETLARVQADIEEGYALGLFFTPMIFVNGVELKGFTAPEALVRTVEQLAAANPAPGSAADDRPPTAAERFIADWQAQDVWTIPADTHNWGAGAAAEQARARIVVWGGYHLPTMPELERQIREAMAAGDRDDVRYEFRHFPWDRACNSHVSSTQHPLACRAAAAVEAAGQLAGLDGYWNMHAWLLVHGGAADDASLRGAAGELGLDAEALLAAMSAAGTQEAIAEDVQAGAAGVIVRNRGILPTVYINGKLLQRWELAGHNLIQRILDGL